MPATRRSWATGPERTFGQDPLFAFRLLADIGLRALSPAVNDPATAVQVLDTIQSLLAPLATRDLHGWSSSQMLRSGSLCRRCRRSCIYGLAAPLQAAWRKVVTFCLVVRGSRLGCRAIWSQIRGRYFGWW
jgi:Predicted membrane protein (DUF2254)